MTENGAVVGPSSFECAHHATSNYLHEHTQLNTHTVTRVGNIPAMSNQEQVLF